MVNLVLFNWSFNAAPKILQSAYVDWMQAMFCDGLTMRTILKYLIYILISCTLGSGVGAKNLIVDGHSLHYESWNTEDQTDRPHIILLSGPIDSWHSDSAWWAWLGPELAKSYRVIALDRAGLVENTPDAKVGYQHFAHDLAAALAGLKVKDALVVAFASSNISVQLFLANNPQQSAIKQVIMIDPDVLTDFSIARYQHDAAPFSKNLAAYLDYIKAGRYHARTAQKNAADLAQLHELSGGTKEVDWLYINKLQQARLQVNNQLNLFTEIAMYGQDLAAVASTQWPASMPLTVIDTDFEAEYIDAEQDESLKAGLVAWRQDGTRYYQSITALHPASRYIATSSRAHLYQFAELQNLLKLINELHPFSD